MEIISVLVAVGMLLVVWRMFRERHGVIEHTRPDPGFDQSEGQPEVPEALALLAAGNWTGLTRLYHRIPPSDRYHLIEALGRMAPAAPETPDDADSTTLTICGGVRLVKGLQFKGKGPVRSVLRANLERRREAIAAADRELRDASARNSNDSTALAFQLLAEIGGLGDRARINGLVGRIQASDEDNVYAARNHLLYTSALLEQSAEPMWRAANEWASDPPNAAWLALPARAHIEEWSFAMYDCPHGSAERGAMIERLGDDGFRRHLASLDDLFWSTLLRGPMSGAEHAFAHNHFAFLLHVFRVDDRPGRHLEQIGGNMSLYPWCLLPTGSTAPMRLLSDLRRQYGLDRLPATRSA